MFRDFRDFINRGNVLDLAIAVVIGAAFGKIITSFIDDVLMPPIGMLLGKADFSQLYINLSGGSYPSLDAAKAAGAVTLRYGAFLNTIIQFLIVAFSVFVVVRMYNRMRPAPAEPAVLEPAERECPHCRMKVPAAATRCAFCTSQIGSVSVPIAQVQVSDAGV